MLTLKQIENKCLHGDGSSQCRYLAEDQQNQFFCVKHTSYKTVLDMEVSAFKARKKLQGVDPYTYDTPLGDNCKGYIFLKHKQQGYDVP